MTDIIRMLIGENLDTDPLGLGQNLEGDLVDGYRVDRSIIHVPQAQIGDGLAGPPNDQPLQIFHDDRPIATDELGMQGPFIWDAHKLARHRAGRTFPLNMDWDPQIDHDLPGRPPRQQVRRASPLYWGQEPAAHDGVDPAQVGPNANTVYATATPNVGWEGY